MFLRLCPCFEKKFSVKLDEQVVTVRVSEEMEYILNKLRIDTGN